MRILIIDDNISDTELAKLALKGMPKLEFTCVSDLKKFKGIFKPDLFDAVLSDYNLSGALGTDVLEYVRSLDAEIPFIIISGALGEEKAVDILRQGATDYVLKENLKKLPLALSRALTEAANKKAEKLANEKLRSINFNSPDFMNTVDRNGTITYSNRFIEGFNEGDIIGENVMKFVPVEWREKYNEHFAKALKGIPQIFEMEAYGKNWTPAWYTIRMAGEETGGKINSVLIISTDITLRKEAQIREEVVSNISQELNKDISVDEFLQKIRLELGRVFPTDNFYVSSYNKKRDELTFIFQYIDDEPDPGVPHSRISGNGLSEYVIKTKKSLLLLGDTIFDFQKKKGIIAHIEDTCSWMGVPVMREQEVLGVVAVLSFTDKGAFKEKDKELLTFVGSQIGAFMGHKEASEKLKDSQFKWDSLVKNSDDVILTVSTDRDINYINKLPANFKPLGLGFNKLIGEKFETMVAEKNREMVLQKLEESLGENIASSFIMEGGITGNYYNCTATPLVQEGKPQGLIIIMKNITELIEAQNKIIESEEKYKSVVQDQTEYIVRWKPTGEILFANQSYLDFSESSIEDLHQTNYFSLVPSNERKRFEKKIKTLDKTNPVQIDSHQTSRGKTGNYWHEWVDRAFFDEKGKVIEYQSVGRDITRQKEAELEIRKSEEFIQSILSALISGIAVIDKDGVIISTNETWNSLQSSNVGGLLKVGMGANYLDMCTKMVKAGDETVMSALIGIQEVLAGKRELFELEYRSNSKGRWFLMRVSPFKSDEGGAVIAHYDITEKKQKEEELRDYKNKLEDLVESRTAKLNEVNLELEAFNYSVSHDLRTPIRAIDIYTGLLSQELESTELHQYVQQIVRCTKEMNDLIKALMEFSKMNKAPISIEKIHLNDFVYHAFEKQKEFENVPNAVLKMNGMPVVLADNKLLNIVFNNLLSNAIKYSSKKKTPTVEVGYAETDEKYVIYIKDNGAGFNSQLSEKLFKPFSRLHHGEEFKGTGAGLAIVERIIRRHHGTIYAEAEVDKGAVFYFTLPKKYEHITQ